MSQDTVSTCLLMVPVGYCRYKSYFPFQHVILTKLDRILISCNTLLRGSGTWRAHEAYLNGLSVLRNLVRSKDLMSNFVPLLKEEVLSAVSEFSQFYRFIFIGEFKKLC